MAKVLFTGGPANGRKFNIADDVRMRHVTTFNNRGRLMTAVYHRQGDDSFKFSYYMGQGKEWRDD